MTLRKNITTILFAALAACMLTACFSDDTTNGDRPLCEITIDEASVKTVYNIYKNETLTITPVCSHPSDHSCLKSYRIYLPIFVCVYDEQ